MTMITGAQVLEFANDQKTPDKSYLYIQLKGKAKEFKYFSKLPKDGLFDTTQDFGETYLEQCDMANCYDFEDAFAEWLNVKNRIESIKSKLEGEDLAFFVSRCSDLLSVVE